MLKLFATAMVLALFGTPALAQSTDTGEATSQQSETQKSNGTHPAVEEVVVTARMRAESIRDVPGTISAVSVDQLEAKGPITGTGDLLSSVAGVRFNGLDSMNLSEISIRGSGTERATGADSGVGIFVNGAYAGSSTLGGRNFKTLDYFDLERIEVLEGPQGALYGRNSEFGEVNIILTKPKFENAAAVRDMYTFDLNQNRLSAVFNRALNDVVAVRFGAETYGQTKGFYYDPDHNKYYDTTNGWTVRGQIRYLSGPVDLTLLYDAQDLRLPTFVNSLNVPGGGVNPQIPLGYQQSRFILPHTGQDGLQQKVQRLMLMGSFQLSDGLKLESTTMATRWHSSQQYAAAIDEATEVSMRQQGEIGIYPYAQIATDVGDRTIYQDLHLNGTAAGGNLLWIAGAEGLYQRDVYGLTSSTTPCAFTLAASFCEGTPSDPLCVKPLPTSTACPTPFPLPYGTNSLALQRISSAAGYISLQYNIEHLSLVGEGRFTHDEKKILQGITNLYSTNYVKVPATYTFDANQPVWTFTGSYKIANDTNTLLYAKVGTGYRAGGVNNGTANAAAPNPYQFTYGNEKTIGYEAGVKTNVTQNIFVRLSAYVSRTDNAITSINDGCAVTNACGAAAQYFNINGGTIHARGLESTINSSFQVGGGRLGVDLNAARQEAHFTNIPAGVAGLPLLGSTVAQTPNWTLSAVANYSHMITGDISGFINVNYSGQRGGGQDTITIATPYIPLSNFDIFGSQAGLAFGKWEVNAFVTNLTNEAVQVLKFTQANYPLSVRWNQPRTYGVSAAYRW